MCLDQIDGAFKVDNSGSLRMQLWFMTIFAKKLNEKCSYDWKRLARNMEFVYEDRMRLYDRYSGVDEMIQNINDANERTYEKCIEMLKELERIKGGELHYSDLKPALEKIGRTDISKYLFIEKESYFVEIIF